MMTNGLATSALITLGLGMEEVSGEPSTIAIIVAVNSKITDILTVNSKIADPLTVNSFLQGEEVE